MTCRFCDSDLVLDVIDLGMSPLCQKHVRPRDIMKLEPFYPLQVFVCSNCWLMQINELESPQVIFDDEYAYFSSYSDSWLLHCKHYCASIVDRLGLNQDDFVIEIGSNDGYLLQWFLEKGIKVLGIEPTKNTANVAAKKGIQTETRFFTQECSRYLKQKYGVADLLIGNNVLAHVPDINDFVGAMKNILARNGVITMEFPHLLRLLENNQFDTIYHEHFSYLSLITTTKIFDKHGLRVFDVEELNTHGGSLRIYACHKENEANSISNEVASILKKESIAGIDDFRCYQDFSNRVHDTKHKLLEFLIEAKRQGKRIVGYGAPGKGNTLLNFCGIRTDFIDYTVDRNPHKQGNYLPGSRIPIFAPDKIDETRPDYVLILPWNLKEEISRQMSHIREWGGKFVIPIPEVHIF